MSAVRLQFKDFLFPANPYTVEISTAKTLSDQKAPGWRTTTQEICADPAVITVQGELYGDTAREEMHAMTALQRESGSGELYIPYDDSRRVFFEKLTFTIAADGERITYRAVFKEDMRAPKPICVVTKTAVQSGENLFDIAARCGVPLEALIQRNGLKSPFDITEGQEILIHDDLA